MTATAEIVRARRVSRQPKSKAPASCSWTVRPQPDADRPGSWSAVLSIGEDTYDIRKSDTWDDETGHHWAVYDLFKRGTDKHHRCCIGPDGEQCDCEHSTYRP